MRQPPQVTREPSPWRPQLRLFMEAAEIAFVVGLHAFFRWWAAVRSAWRRIREQ